MCWSHYDPSNYYQTLFDLQYSHHFTIDQVEKMYPFELVIYVEMLNRRLDEKRRAQQQQEAARKLNGR